MLNLTIFLDEVIFYLANNLLKEYFPYKIEPYKRNEYIKEYWFKAMPDEMFNILEKLRWHLCITTTKM